MKTLATHMVEAGNKCPMARSEKNSTVSVNAIVDGTIEVSKIVV